MTLLQPAPAQSTRAQSTSAQSTRFRPTRTRSNSPLFDELAALVPVPARPLSPITPVTPGGDPGSGRQSVAGLILELLDDDTKATRRWPFHSVQ